MDRSGTVSENDSTTSFQQQFCAQLANFKVEIKLMLLSVSQSLVEASQVANSEPLESSTLSHLIELVEVVATDVTITSPVSFTSSRI